jgi:hypothetical protein
MLHVIRRQWLFLMSSKFFEASEDILGCWCNNDLQKLKWPCQLLLYVDGINDNDNVVLLMAQVSFYQLLDLATQEASDPPIAAIHDVTSRGLRGGTPNMVSGRATGISGLWNTDFCFPLIAPSPGCIVSLTKDMLHLIYNHHNGNLNM